MNSGAEEADGTDRRAMAERRPALEILLVFLRLGCTGFGGPVAHIGYFREEFVTRRKWLDDHAFADMVALCQFLPGPASSQVGFAIGLTRGGPLGALAAWAGFTLPSALLLMAFAGSVMLGAPAGAGGAGWLHGLKLVALAVVAQAALQMGRSLCPDAPRATLAVLAAGFMLVAAPTHGQLYVIVAGALAGLLLPAPAEAEIAASGTRKAGLAPGIGPRGALFCLLLFFILLFGLPLLAATGDSPLLHMADIFYRAGALVFGGGHVVLPLLEAEVVPAGLVDHDTFLAGYGMAQAVPGPLFTFGAYLGAHAGAANALDAGGAGMAGGITGAITGGIVALIAIFGSTFLLVPAALPFWARLRANRQSRAALGGVNAAVVGLILAALYDPVFTGSVFSATDFALAALAWLAIAVWKVPPWLVVPGGALIGWAMAAGGWAA